MAYYSSYVVIECRKFVAPNGSESVLENQVFDQKDTDLIRFNNDEYEFVIRNRLTGIFTNVSTLCVKDNV